MTCKSSSKPPPIKIKQGASFFGATQYLDYASTAITGIAAQSTIVVASTDGLIIGMRAMGAGIAEGATIVSIVGLVVRLSINNVGIVSGDGYFEIAKSLVGVELKSQVRSGDNTLYSDITIDITDEAAGTFNFSAPSTAGWPIDTIYWDIVATDGGIIMPTQTKEIAVEWGATK